MYILVMEDLEEHEGLVGNEQRSNIFFSKGANLKSAISGIINVESEFTNQVFRHSS